MRVLVLDLDGGVAAQTEFAGRGDATVVPARDWGPRVRICCSFARFARFERECVGPRLDGRDGPAIVFGGSGDFHHVTLALLRRAREPFNLLVLDRHPDWMAGAPILHCGTWVHHALRLPLLHRLYHLGGDLDFDNWLRPFAPWRLLRDGRVRVTPAVRRFARGGWRSVPCETWRAAPDRPADAERLGSLCGGFRPDLERRPLYVSIDKDVMRTADALVNWDSGRMELGEVEAALAWFIQAARGRLIGMDVFGDWSRPVTRGLLRGVLNRTERRGIRVDPEEAAIVNGRTNQSLVATVRRAMAAANRETGRDPRPSR